MPVVHTAAFRFEVEKVHSYGPYIWLWEIVADRTVIATTLFRLVRYNEEIQHDFDDGRGVLTFYPFPISQTPIVEKGGSLPTLQVSIDNTMRFAAPYIDQGQGFIGNRATATLIPHALLRTGPGSDPGDYQQRDFVIAGVTINEKTITFRLEMPNFFQRQSPPKRFNAQRCTHRFGTGLCPYVLSSKAAFIACNKTILECTERGDDMVARRFPRLLPLYFGGWPGIALRP